MGIAYSVRRSRRARNMRLEIHPDASVVVTAPRLFGFEAIERFVEKHASWIARHVEKMRGKEVLKIKRSEIPMLKRRAARFSAARCAHFAKIYGVRYRKISIRAQKSRWGSCSLNGNLSFNYKIALLSPHLADYIIVHELCHLLEMNHSKRFWAHVARTIPAYKLLRKKMRNIATMNV